MCRADHKSSLTLSPQLHGSHHWVKTNIPKSDGRPTSEDLETCAAGKTFPKQPGRDAELAIHSSLVTLILTSWFPAGGTKTSSTLSLLMPFSSTILLGCLCGQVRSDYQQGVTNDWVDCSAYNKSGGHGDFSLPGMSEWNCICWSGAWRARFHQLRHPQALMGRQIHVLNRIEWDW